MSRHTPSEDPRGNFSRIFATSPVPMTVTEGASGLTLDCNPAFCAVTGYPRSEVVGQTMGDLALWFDPQIRRKLVAGFPEEQVISDVEFPFRTRDGRQRWARGTYSSIRYSGRDCILASGLDITAERELREALDTAYRSAGQTYDLLENLLGWVQGQREGLAERFVRTPLVPTLAAVTGWLGSQAEAKELRLTIEAPPELEVVTDPETLQTIVRNLVSNAVKYSPPGGAVQLKGTPGPDGVEIAVVDRGCGIPGAKLAQLFGDQRVDSRPGTQGESGHGLGLMFSADLARSLGGRLTVESTPGLGSTFTLRVPGT